MASCSLGRSVVLLLPLLYAGCADREYTYAPYQNVPSIPPSPRTSFAAPASSISLANAIPVPPLLPRPVLATQLVPSAVIVSSSLDSSPSVPSNTTAAFTNVSRPGLAWPGLDLPYLGSSTAMMNAAHAQPDEPGKSTREEEKLEDKKDPDNGKKDDKDKDDKDKEKEEDKFKLLPKGWNFHGQSTIIPILQPGFGAQYSGPNSLSQTAQRTGTISADLFLGAPLLQGAEFHADLLLWQGYGLTNAFGLEASPNNDAFKAGTTDPRFMFAHFFVRQTIGLGGEQEDVPDGFLTLPGKRDISRFTITAGRLSVMDIFDNNSYNHDAHTQFFNWSSSMLTWDYAADTIGYTTGIALELNEKDWTLRYGWFQLPGTPNGFTSDDRIFAWPVDEPGDARTSDGEFWKEWGMILELERRWQLENRPGAVRLQAWADHGYLASYNAATPLLLASPPSPTTGQGVETTVPGAAFGFHYKYGFGVNWEQEIAQNVGIFGRLGWQDGQTAAAAYTDVDWTAQLGVSFKGAAWQRPGDTFGLVGNLAGASSAQQAFLKAGGTGILNGDGHLSYAPETSFETYYDIAVTKGFRLAFDYQFFANPAFNRDRGPVNVFQARLHWDF